MRRLSLIAFPLALCVGCLLGCQVQGHRKISTVIAGMEFSFEDQIYPNTNGEDVYKAIFTPEFMEWLSRQGDEPQAETATAGT